MLGQHLVRAGDLHAEPPGHLRDALLVPGVDEREEQADGERFGAAALHPVQHRRDLRLIQGLHDAAVGRDALIHFEAAGVGDQRIGRVGCKA